MKSKSLKFLPLLIVAVFIIFYIFFLIYTHYTSPPLPNIGIIPATVALGDRGFSDDAFTGIVAAQVDHEFNFTFAEVESAEDVMTHMQRMASSGEYDLILVLSSLPESVEAVIYGSTYFPDQKISHIDATVDLPNVSGIQTNFAEQLFLTGVIAGLGTKSEEMPLSNPHENKIGVLLAQDIPLLRHALVGYTAGAKYVNPDIEVSHIFINSFYDEERVYNAAIGLYDNGVDFIQALVSGLGGFIHNAAREMNRYSFASGMNGNYMQPNHIVATAQRNLPNMVYEEITSLIDGTWTPGLKIKGIRDGAVGLNREHSNVDLPADIEDALRAIESKLLDGSLIIPTEMELLEMWLMNNRYTP